MTRAPALTLEPPKYYVHRVRDTDSQSKLSIVLSLTRPTYNSTHQHRHRKSSAPSSSCVDALATTSTPPQLIASSCAGGRAVALALRASLPRRAARRALPHRLRRVAGLQHVEPRAPPLLGARHLGGLRVLQLRVRIEERSPRRRPPARPPRGTACPARPPTAAGSRRRRARGTPPRPCRAGRRPPAGTSRGACPRTAACARRGGRGVRQLARRPPLSSTRPSAARTRPRPAPTCRATRARATAPPR